MDVTERDEGSAGLPLIFPDPHPDAVATRAVEVIPFADDLLRVAFGGDGLFWWQRAVLARALEVDVNGRYCWPRVNLVVPRQSGKTALGAVLSIWRAQSERQTALLASKSLVQAGRIMARWEQWAKNNDATKVVKLRDNPLLGWGDTTGEASWMIRAANSAYGESSSLLVLDEAWYWDQSTWGSLTPILAMRPDPQAWAMTASNEHIKDLVPMLLDNSGVLNMVWGAHAEENALDPRTWKAASPYWDAARESEMRQGQGFRNFRYEWLSLLPEQNTGRRPWLPEWPAAQVLSPPLSGAVGAVDKGTLPEEAFSAVVAWKDAEGRVALIAKTEIPTIEEAVAWCREQKAERTVVGLTYMKTVPPLRPYEIVSGTTKRTGENSRLFAALVHEGRIVTDGSLLVDHARADDHGILSPKHSLAEVTAVKCAVWAAGEALRQDKPVVPKAQVW